MGVDPEDGGAEFVADVGQNEPGEPTGTLSNESSEPDPDIDDPSSLTANLDPEVENGTNQVITDSNGAISQIMNGSWNGGSPNVRSLVNINTAATNGYTIEYYRDATWDGTNSDWDPVGNASRKVKIEDLGPGSDGTIVRITDSSYETTNGMLIAEDVSEFQWDATNSRWVLAEGINTSTNIALRKTWVEITETGDTRITAQVISAHSTSNIVSKVVEKHQIIGDDRLLIERRVISDPANDIASSTENWSYIGRNPRLYTSDDGAWTYYAYGDDGRLIKSVSSLGDEGEFDPIDPDGSEPGNLVTTYRQQLTDLSDAHTNDGVEVIRETIQLIEDPSNLGTMIPVATTYSIIWSYDTTNGTEYESWEVVCASADPKAGYAGADDEAKTTAFLNAMFSDADHLGHYVTKSVFAAPGQDAAFRLVRVENPDGTVALNGRSVAGSVRTRTTERGFPTRDGSGNITGIAHGTKRTTVIDTSDGSETVTRQKIVRGGSWTTMYYSESTSEDVFGRPLAFDFYYGTKASNPGGNTADYSTATAFGHYGIVSQTDEWGLVSNYGHDALGRPETIDTNDGTVGALRIIKAYDPAGRVVSRSRQGLDSQGNTTTAIILSEQRTFDATGRLTSRTDGAGVKSFYTYGLVKLDGTTYDPQTDTGPIYSETREYPHEAEAGPISVQRFNRLGQVVLQYEAKLTDAVTDDWNSAAPTGTETLTPLSRQAYAYDWRGIRVRERVYFKIDTLTGFGDEGTAGTHYYESSILAVDRLGRLLRRVDETGNIGASVYDSAGRVTESWIGTDDTGATASDPSGGGAGGNNMALVRKFYYDDSRDGTGDLLDYRTRVEYLKPSLTSLSGTNSDYTGTDFEQLLAADSETSWSKPDYGPWSSSTRTHDDRIVETLHTANGSTTMLLAKATWHYDTANGRPWRLESTRRYETNAGVAGLYLETSYEYDDAERRIKEHMSRGGYIQTDYDNLGRSWRTRNHVDANTVLVQSETIFDGADRPVASVELARYHDDTTTVGPLSKTNSVLDVLVNRYDSGGRLERTVDFGQDNGSTRYVFDTQGSLIDSDTNGIPDEAESTGTLRTPDTSDDYRVSVTTFDERGLTHEVERNDGRKTRYSYDAMGRRVSMIENYVDGTPGTDDSDRITKWTFNSVGQSKTVEAQLATGTIQTQTFVYSSELTDKGSPVSRNDLLRAKIHADSDDSVASNQLNDNAGGYDREEYTYYANGQVEWSTDRRGVKTWRYHNDAGWLLAVEIHAATGSTWAPTGTRCIDYAYGDAGELTTVWSYNGEFQTDLASKLTYTYDGFYNRLTETQDHDPTANSGVGVSQTISYAYDTTSSGGQYTNGYRLDTVTYPSGRVIQLDYSGHNGIDDSIGRVTKLQDYDGGGANDTDIVAYDYLGSSSLVRKRYPTPGVRLDMIDEASEGSSVDDPYDASWDRYGQATRYQWEKYNTSTDAGDEDRLHIAHGYDRSGRRLYDDRKVYTGFSRTFDHDQLDRVTDTHRGMLIDNAGTKEIDWVRRSEDTTLDQLGNPTQIDRETKAPYTQNITHNEANELESREVYERSKSTRIRDAFSSSATASNWDVPGSDTFNISGGYLQPTSVTADTINGQTEAASHGLFLWGPELGPVSNETWFTFDPSITTTTRAGFVFGYQDPQNYWIVALKYVPGGQNKNEICQVVNGVLTVVKSQNVALTLGVQIRTHIGSTRSLIANGGLTYKFTGGYPSGRAGIYTDSALVKFNQIDIYPHDEPSDLSGRWDRHSSSDSATSGIAVINTDTRRHYPTFLRGVTLPASQPWRTTLMLTRSGASRNWDGLRFLFNVRDHDTYSALTIHHAASTKNPGSATEFVGGSGTSYSGTATSANVATAANQSDKLWTRIESDGTNVSVKMIVDNSGAPSESAWSSTGVAYTSPNFNMTGGGIGLRATYGTTYIKHVKVETDANNDSTFVTEYEDDISAWANYEPITHEHDAAGNMTFDGEKSYAYDSQNRLVTVSNAYRDDQGDVQDGSPLAEYEYDAQGRRIVEKTYVGGVLDTYLHHYYIGWSLIETRDNYSGTGGPRLVTQYVWDNLAGHYTDSLAEIGHNVNLASGPGDNVIDRRFYAMQDQQYNLMALLDERGVMIERYEYSLHGERNIFRRSDFNERIMHADLDYDGDIDTDDMLIMIGNSDVGPGATHKQGDVDGNGYIDDLFADWEPLEDAFTGPLTTDNDSKALTPVLRSTRLFTSGVSLCRVGFTGQFHDPATGLVHMRNRDYVPSLGRFLTRDPAGDVDGQNVYVGHFAMSLGTDATGLYVGEDLVNGYLDLAEEGWNSIAPSAARTSDSHIASYLRQLRSKKRLLNAQAKRLGRDVQRMQDRMGNCPFDPSGQEPLAEEIYEGIKSWVNIFYSANKRLADGYGNSRQQGELLDIGVSTAFRGIPAGDPEGVLRKWRNANGLLNDALSAEDDLLSQQIQYLEYAQTGTNVALMVTGAGAITANVVRVGVTQGVKAASGTVACYATSIAVGVGASHGARAIIGTLNLDPYAEEAIGVGVDFMVGILTPKFCFPAGTVVWCVDEDGDLVQKKIEQVTDDDTVIAYNHETQQWEPCKVEATYANDYDGVMVDVQYVVDGMGPLTETITSTGGHPFWVTQGKGLEARKFPIFDAGQDGMNSPNGGRWIAAEDLKPGDVLLLKDGRSATVSGLTVRTECTRVYNFSVERLHNYSVGNFGVLTHNVCRNGAFNRAKKDSGIPKSQQPDTHIDPKTGQQQQYRKVPMTDRNGKQILDENGRPVTTREYTFTREDGSQVVIQDHSHGHAFGAPGGEGDHGPHFNVRPADDLRHGTVPGTDPHYPFDQNGG